MIRTRFAPSPTGYLHVGGVRTALYSWLLARRHGGVFILRIEDTDRERSTEPAIKAILDGMSWLGLEPDEAPVFQTARFDRYAEVADQLLASGKAYRCYCTREEIDSMRAAAEAEGRKPRYDGRCRDRTGPRDGVDPVVRFRSPDDGVLEVNDVVKGAVRFDNAELDDLIIVRSNGTPTYNFTVVVDDVDMAITHVIRGDDHLNNTPRQVHMYTALGAQLPMFAHLPMIHGPDGAKLSKRHGAVSVLEYREAGYLPDGLLNYLLRLGWSHGDEEVFTRDQMIANFDLDGIGRSAANFDSDKLRWINQQHIQMTAREDLELMLASALQRAGREASAGPPLGLAVEALRERSATIAEMAELADCYYADFDDYDPKAAKTHLRPVVRDALASLREALAAVGEWTPAELERAVADVADSLDMRLGKVAQPLRVALTGRAASPGIGVTLELVGRARALGRIERAIQFVDSRAARQE